MHNQFSSMSLTLYCWMFLWLLH